MSGGASVTATQRPPGPPRRCKLTGVLSKAVPVTAARTPSAGDHGGSTGPTVTLAGIAPVDVLLYQSVRKKRVEKQALPASSSKATSLASPSKACVYLRLPSAASHLPGPLRISRPRSHVGMVPSTAHGRALTSSSASSHHSTKLCSIAAFAVASSVSTARASGARRLRLDTRGGRSRAEQQPASKSAMCTHGHTLLKCDPLYQSRTPFGP
eukprot:7378283-Prymnesium_polylepis.2